jgi:ABC-type lipopolysaccharide export system ATPase subunit
MEFEEKFFEMKQQRIVSLADEKVLQQQIAYRFPKGKKQRMRALLSKSNAGVITQAEKLELDELIEEFEQKSLEKAEAMYLLAQRKQKVEVARNEAINPDKSEEALSEPIEDYTKVR